MISVVIPLYNKAGQVAHTLRSVLGQTFREFEVVIVDDGSTDGSADEARSVHDGRIRLVSQRNAGVSAARNRGVAEARYDLIAFLDADDEWKPTYLETQYNLYRKYPDCSLFACNYEFRNADGRVTPTILHKLPFEGEYGILSNYFEVASCSHPPLWTSAVMVRKQALQAVGGFPVGIKSGEDLLTWARLAVAGKIAFSRKPLATFVFDARLFNEDQNKREPEVKDVVGDELKELYKHNLQICGLKEYNALWHKMRARIYIDKKNRRGALMECCRAMCYHINGKIIVFFALSLLPYSVSHYVFSKLS